MRTGSLRTAYLLHTERAGRAEVRLPGFGGSFGFRTGTTDAEFLRVLVERQIPPEYELPVEIHPGTILDIGANIGTVTAALVRLYPDFQVFAFEPLPENFELLEHNAAQFPNVTTLPYGLGARTERLTYERSDNPRNFGGGGFHGAKSDPQRCVSLPVVAVPEALERLRIGPIDLIKIDTEGAEREILTSFPEAVLKEVEVIVGEMHAKPRDDELLQYLEEWFHVVLGSRKGRPHWFKAFRRRPQPGGRVADLVGAIPRGWEADGRAGDRDAGTSARQPFQPDQGVSLVGPGGPG